MEPLRPGFYSSEFLITLLAKIASVVVAFGVMSQSQSDEWQTHAANAVLGIVSIIWMLSTARAYLTSRTILKQQTANLNAMIPEKSVPMTKIVPTLLIAIAMFCLTGTATAQQAQRVAQPAHPPVQRQANCLGLFGRQQTTDPAIMAALNQQTQILGQIANGQNQILAMLASQRQQPVTRDATPTIFLMQAPGSQQQAQQPTWSQTLPNGVIQTFPLSQQPIQQFPLSQQPIQTFPLSQQPIQVLPLIQQPIQVLPVGAQPIQPLIPNTGHQPIQPLIPSTQPTTQPIQPLIPTGTGGATVPTVTPGITPNPGTIPNSPGARTPAVPTGTGQPMPLAQYRAPSWRAVSK